MARTSIRSAIIVLTLITAIVHLVILGLGIFADTGSVDLLFALNGLGYLVLLGFLLRGFPWAGEQFLQFAFIGYTIVTIFAWYFINGDFSEPLGVFTKAVEVALIISLWIYMQRSETS